jgi:hypothetical protein
MFKILTLQQDGEGIQRHLPPEGYERVSFHALEQAAQHLFDNYGQGLVVTLEGSPVLSV